MEGANSSGLLWVDYSLVNLMYHNSVLTDLLSRSDGGLRTARRAWMGRELPRKRACGSHSPVEAPEDPAAPACWALMESVDCWPMVKPIQKTLGGKPKPVSALGRDWWKVSSSCGVYVTLWDGCKPRTSVRRTALWGTQWGQTDGQGTTRACSVA